MDKREKIQYIREMKKLRLELSENNIKYEKYDEIMNKYKSVLPRILNYSNGQETKTEKSEVKTLQENGQAFILR